MSKELLTFGNIKTENKKLYPHKTNFLGDVDIEKVLLSSMGKYVKYFRYFYKYFIGYLYSQTIKYNAS